MQVRDVADQVALYPWYHTLDLGGGIVTPGMFDHRGTEDAHLIPADLRGQRCLDVGTMDGYWAFCMERRGASEVVAVDIDDSGMLDWPGAQRGHVVTTLDDTKETRFRIAQAALRSSVERHLCSVYALDAAEIGTFDFVFCGDLLVHLKDPVTALERIRSVCRSVAVVCNPVREQLFRRRRPLAYFDGIDEFQWWVPNSAALVRMMRAAGFAEVEVGSHFSLPARGGGPWKGHRCAARARV